MIERVILTLRELASGMHDEPSSSAAGHDLGDRLQRSGADFADAYRLLADCPQLHVSSRQAESLERLYKTLFELESVQGSADESNRVGNVLSLHDVIRAMAVDALAELGEEVHPRSPD